MVQLGAEERIARAIRHQAAAPIVHHVDVPTGPGFNARLPQQIAAMATRTLATGPEVAALHYGQGVGSAAVQGKFYPAMWSKCGSVRLVPAGEQEHHAQKACQQKGFATKYHRWRKGIAQFPFCWPLCRDLSKASIGCALVGTDEQKGATSRGGRFRPIEVVRVSVTRTWEEQVGTFHTELGRCTLLKVYVPMLDQYTSPAITFAPCQPVCFVRCDPGPFL